MGAFVALISLLLIGLLWRWFVWRKRFAVLTDRLAELGKITADVAKRLERAEQQLELRSVSLTPTTISTETAQPHPEEAGPLFPAAPPREEVQEAPFIARTVLPEVKVTGFASDRSGEERLPKRLEADTVQWRPTPEVHARKPWRTIPSQLSELVGTKRGRAVDWETLIGGSWLNVIGIVVFVVGMALFAQYSLRQFGPIGKITTGLVASSLLLVCGTLLERLVRYRLLAWSLTGGGWALLYFTAYAAHNIEASKVITDPAAGLLLMGGVAAGIIAHSIRYRSQLLTGLAYGLGFFAVAITPLNSYTLIAAALLALSQIAILRFLHWDYLVLVAVAGTYLNHARWLGETAELREDFWLSQGILGLYWLLFVAMAFLRKPTSRQDSLIPVKGEVVMDGEGESRFNGDRHQHRDQWSQPSGECKSQGCGQRVPDRVDDAVTVVVERNSVCAISGDYKVSILKNFPACLKQNGQDEPRADRELPADEPQQEIKPEPMQQM